MNLIQLEQAYKTFISNLENWAPEGIIEVDFALLEKTGLLNAESFSEEYPHYFHVIEARDKVLLFNHRFVVWIVPKIIHELPTTIVMIALISEQHLNLEIVFSTQGTYNTPKCILKLLKYYLSEVTDTEDSLSSINIPS